MIRRNSLSLQLRLWLLMAGFAGLVLISVATTFIGLQAQAHDATLINLAGRQRMLVQQMARLAAQTGEPTEAAPTAQAELEAGLRLYEQTHAALTDGGQAPRLDGQTTLLPATTDPEALALLNEIDQTWSFFRSALLTLLADPQAPAAAPALTQINRSAPLLVSRHDALVQRYESLAQGRVLRLRQVQSAFLLAAAMLLAAGVWVIRGAILQPLADLRRAAERIGHSDLHTPVPPSGPPETMLVGQTLETMRTQLLASQDALQQWGRQLEGRVQQRTAALESLHSLSQEIAANLDVSDVLCSVTEKARQLVGGEAAFLCLMSPDDRQLALQSACGADDAVAQATTQVDGKWANRVLSAPGGLRGGQQTGCTGSPEGCRSYCQIVAAPYRASHLAAPLRLGERVIGALCVASRTPNAFSDDAEKLLGQLAAAAALALNNAHLYRQAERVAVLEERQRLAADMHDGLTQTISYLRLMVDALGEQDPLAQPELWRRTLGRINTAIEQAEGESRSAIHSLGEEFPVALALQDQLAALASGASEPPPIPGTPPVSITWRSDLRAPLLLHRAEAEQVLHVVREAIANARRHAGAGCIQLSLARQAGQAIISIQDDGHGFDPHAAPPADGRQHFGLKIMHARAARLGGTLDIDSAPGRGATIRLIWPLTGAASNE